MKLHDLKEMAVDTVVSFDLTTKQWTQKVAELASSKRFRQVTDGQEVRKHDTTFSLWLGDDMVSFAQFKPITIGATKYLSLVMIASDPSANSRGYASGLLWNIYTGQDKPLYIGGAISKKGQDFMKSFLHRSFPNDGAGLDMIDSVTGDTQPFNWQTFMSKNRLGIVLDSGHIDERVQVTEDSGVWIYDPRHFEGTP